MYHCIIIGKGPAGLQAATYIARAGKRVLVIDAGDSSLSKAEKIDNYFGFEETISGEELLRRGTVQAKRFGAEIITGEVLNVSYGTEPESFNITTAEKIYRSHTVLITTGKPLPALKIPGAREFEGRGVSYCVSCDGFFYRNSSVGILGNMDYAIREAEELTNYTQKITVYTNGAPLELSDKMKDKAFAFNIVQKPIRAFIGDEALQAVSFEDGSSDEISGLFIALGRPSGIDFAKKLGVVTEGGSILTDANMKTSVDGIYAAGDCAASFKQISVAVGQAAIAAKSIIGK